MNVRWLGLALAGLMLCPAAAKAGVVISIDMDTNTAGIQNSLTLLPGDTNNFTVDVYMEITDATLVSYYSFGVRVDDDEMDFVSRQRFFNNGWAQIGGNLPVLSGSGDPLLGPGNYRTVQDFSGAVFDVNDSVGAGTYLIGRITVTPTGPLNDAFIDFSPGFYNAGVDLIADETDTPLAGVVFNGGTLSAVPEPSSFLALGGCVAAGVAGRMRRRKKAAKN